MSNRKLWTYVLVGIAVATITASFVIFKPKNKNEPDITSTKVGAIIPLTGDVATYGVSLKKGFDLAAANFDGKIEVVYEDSKASPKDGITAMQKLLGKGVRHFLGDATSGVSLALAPLANQNQAILMIDIATSDDLTKAGPYVFRNCPPNRKQAAAAADFMKNNLKATRIAVLAKANPYAANLAAQFRVDSSSRSLEIVLDEQYDPSVRDFSILIDKLKKANPQAVFIPGNYEETASILRKARELGFSAPFIGTDGAYSPKLLELAGQAAEGFYLTMLGVDRTTPFYKHFASSYAAKYSGEPDVFTAYGYEGAMILFQVIAQGGNVSDQLHRLESGSWDGLLGRVSFDPDGEIVRNVQVLVVQNGIFTEQK